MAFLKKIYSLLRITIYSANDVSTYRKCSTLVAYAPAFYKNINSQIRS